MSKKVLLCDDEVHILRAAEINISRAGYDVVTTHDGEQAWKLIQQDPPDLLVTDLQMPRCDGLELAGRIHDDPACKDIQIVMLSAKGYELSRKDLADRGIVELLSKPFSPRQLVSVINKILNPAPLAAK